MNFEFKSTFNKINTAVFFRVNRSLCSVCMLLINLTSLFLVAGLYLENIIIPATYGSGPLAPVWLGVFRVAAAFWMITTTFAMLHLIYTCVHRNPVFIFLKNGFARLLTVVKGTTRVQLIQFLLVIHLLKNLERYTQHRAMRKHVLFTDQFIYPQNILLTN